MNITPLRIAIIIVAGLLVGIGACDHGLDPQPDVVKPGFDGTVTIVEGWADNSEIRQVYVVVFKTVPEDSADAVDQFFRGEIQFTGLEPPFQDEYSYSVDINSGTYELVVCIGVRGDQFLNVANWVLTGIYTETGNPFEPSMITVPENGRLPDIDMLASVIHTLPVPF
jgi:hypothetical protein